MAKKTKTTKIEKKWKDKKTGQERTLTINYAKVADRLLEFRADSPRGLIETSPEFKSDGVVVFRARILKDKADENSPEATGHTIGNTKFEKNFEKLETMAVGRALALLGYLASGEIASSEEMEQFNEYKTEKKEDSILSLRAAKTLDELKDVYMSLGHLMADVEVVKVKDECKINLTKQS